MASQRTLNDSEEALEELDLDDAALISHQSELHTPARRQVVRVDEPSVVVLDEPEPNIHESGPRQATTRRGNRAMEPTLMIRDRRAATELRREMERRVKELKQRRVRSTLMWVVLGVVAFGLGGLLAFVVAKRQTLAQTSTDSTPPRIEPVVPEKPLPKQEPADKQEAAQEYRTIDLDVDQ